MCDLVFWKIRNLQFSVKITDAITGLDLTSTLQNNKNYNSTDIVAYPVKNSRIFTLGPSITKNREIDYCLQRFSHLAT